MASHLDDLDSYFGPKRPVTGGYQTPSGRWYARLSCGHKVRASYINLERPQFSGQHLQLRCHVCKRALERKVGQ